MNVKIFFKTVCGTLISLLLLSGCNTDIDNGFITSIHMRDKFNQTADTFSPGADETIHMTLSIKNDSTSEKTLSFPSNYQYDFIITDEADNEIWLWSTLSLPPENRVDIETSFSLGPTDIQTITYTWNQVIDTIETTVTVDDVETTDIKNILILPGSYTLKAYFVGYEDQAAQTTLTINP